MRHCRTSEISGRTMNQVIFTSLFSSHLYTIKWVLQRPKQIVVGRGKVRAIRRMHQNFPAKLSQFLLLFFWFRSVSAAIHKWKLGSLNFSCGFQVLSFFWYPVLCKWFKTVLWSMFSSVAMSRHEIWYGGLPRFF